MACCAFFCHSQTNMFHSCRLLISSQWLCHQVDLVWGSWSTLAAQHRPHTCPGWTQGARMVRRGRMQLRRLKLEQPHFCLTLVCSLNSSHCSVPHGNSVMATFSNERALHILCIKIKRPVTKACKQLEGTTTAGVTRFGAGGGTTAAGEGASYYYQPTFLPGQVPGDLSVCKCHFANNFIRAGERNC